MNTVSKRMVDVIGATAGLILLAPVMLATGASILVGMGRPVLFVQARGGKGGAPFRYLKFRTMTNARDAQGDLLPDDQRLTRFGRFLRASTLDELPSLWNVLKGDMSIVGPRPLFHDYVPLYDEHQRRRLEVKPGLTSWAVIKGRNALSWEERFELDVWYVDNQSFWLDLKIIFLTIGKILKRDDVNQEGHATMPRFQGSREASTRE